MVVTSVQHSALSRRGGAVCGVPPPKLRRHITPPNPASPHQNTATLVFTNSARLRLIATCRQAVLDHDGYTGEIATECGAACRRRRLLPEGARRSAAGRCGVCAFRFLIK